MAAFIRQPLAQGWRSRGTVFIAALAAIGATQFMGLPRPAPRAPFAELTKGVGVGATLNANNNEVALEELHICHEGMERQ